MREDVNKSYEMCQLCPRMCGADRIHGRKGYCGADADMMVARAALHHWEEPCISGSQGSGAVFFSGCAMHCCFCQNYEIADGMRGKKVTAERLAEIFLELQEKGAHNINLVTPTHYIPGIVQSLERAKGQGLILPIVYNTSGYERVETLKILRGLVDIYLPDFKYMDSKLAFAYSQAANYPDMVKSALAEMTDQVGETVFDEETGIMKCGVIVRHLVLPGHVNNSKSVLRYLYETYGDRICISIMNQYTPMPRMKGDKLLGRKVTRREYERVLQEAFDLGITKGFLQEGETAQESFIPLFDEEGV